jgi:gamma-glutamylcysteine synthetase
MRLNMAKHLPPRSIRVASNDFANQHLEELCKELIELRTKNSKPVGRLSQLAAMWQPMYSPGVALHMAETIVNEAACQAVAERALH